MQLDSNPELYIRIVPDKAARTLSIIDSGVGMTKVPNWALRPSTGQCRMTANQVVV